MLIQNMHIFSHVIPIMVTPSLSSSSIKDSGSFGLSVGEGEY